MGRTIFVTGTDTNVGKTVFTSLLLSSLVEQGKSVFPLKLFCSGDRSDAETFHRIIKGNFGLDEINPWFFSEPLTPLIAARNAGVKVEIGEALQKIEDARQRASIVLIEGAGGLLSPLGEGFDALEIISQTEAEAIVVAPDKLGTLNHCLLTVRELRRAAVQQISLVLMEQEKRDLSSNANASLLQELIPAIKILKLPWLHPGELMAIQNGTAPATNSLLCSLIQD